ncbi:MAG: cupin domain-containing protein [Deltaproteobacteria bacterium]|nr:cupin domain-containing protein [Candidatus Anaeroferrophillacea bacterium]
MEQLGRRIRALRKQQGLTLRKVAELAGCSDVFLSQVERSLASPSIASLKKIANALEVSIIDLIQDNPAVEEQVVTRRADRVEFRFPRAEVYSQLLARNVKRKSMQPLYKVVRPGSGSEGEYCHHGEEWGLVLEGALELTVDGREYHLEAGDSFYFNSSHQHGYENRGAVDTVLIWVISPPTF